MKPWLDIEQTQIKKGEIMTNYYLLKAQKHGLRAVAIDNMLEYDQINYKQYDQLTRNEFDNIYYGYLAQLELLLASELLHHEIRLSSVDCTPDFEYKYGDRLLIGMQAYYARELVRNRD